MDLSDGSDGRRSHVKELPAENGGRNVSMGGVVSEESAPHFPELNFLSGHAFFPEKG